MIPILFLMDEIETWGGSERHLYELVRAIDPARYRPTVAVLGKHKELHRFSDAGVEAVRLPVRRVFGPEGIAGVGRIAAFLRRGGHRLIVTYHTASDLLGPFAAAVAGAQAISSRRDMGFTKKPVHVRAQRQVNRLVAAIAAVSSAVRDVVVDGEGYPVDRIRCIANGVDSARFAPRGEAVRARLRAELGCGPEDVLVGTLANYDPIKGYDNLFDAVEPLLARDPRLRLVLPGEGPLLEEFRARAARWGGRVVLPGLRNDVPELLTAMDLFVLASHSEGFSNALLQAMACELPVVATEVGGNRELVTPEVGALVPVRRPELLGQALAAYVDDAARRRAAGAAGRRRVRSEYTFGKMVRAYELLFDEVLAEAGLADAARAPAPLRRTAKHALAVAWGAARPVATRAPRALSTVRGRALAPRALCLCYHRVLPEPATSLDPWLVVGTETLRRQLEALARRYELVTAAELARAIARGGPERPLCAITFDDGYADNLEHAAPVLAAVGAPGTIYVTTSALEGGPPLWFERLAALVEAGFERHGRDAVVAAAVAALLEGESGPVPAGPVDAVGLGRALAAALKDLSPERCRARLDALEERLGAPDPAALPRFLRWEELTELQRLGWEVGAHTRTHPILPNTPDAAAREEIAGVREEIAGRLGRAPEGFAYPNGDWDDRIVELVRAAGYAYAVAATPEQGIAGDLFRLPRRGVSTHSSRGLMGPFSATTFRAELDGILDLAR